MKLGDWIIRCGGVHCVGLNREIVQERMYKISDVSEGTKGVMCKRREKLGSSIESFLSGPPAFSGQKFKAVPSLTLVIISCVSLSH